MKMLAIDTSATACSVALCIDDSIQSIHKIAPMQQSQLILPMIDELLKSSAVSLTDLDALAFGCGPGSFTGVRIAASVIQGLAYASNLPIIKISSLAAIAQAAYTNKGWKKILVGVDARMQEIYWGIYQVNHQGWVELVGQEMISSPENVERPEGFDWYGAGSAWSIYGDLLSTRIQFAPIEMIPEQEPSATSVIELAKIKLIHKDWVTPEEALPVYLRDNVAKKANK